MLCILHFTSVFRIQWDVWTLNTAVNCYKFDMILMDPQMREYMLLRYMLQCYWPWPWWHTHIIPSENILNIMIIFIKFRLKHIVFLYFCPLSDRSTTAISWKLQSRNHLNFWFYQSNQNVECVKFLAARHSKCLNHPNQRLCIFFDWRKFGAQYIRCFVIHFLSHFYTLLA